jgi:hypothetical protein
MFSMEKRLTSALFLIAISLFVLPVVSAQNYSNFERFADNSKLFLSGGDNKVELALEIRENEIDSAIENIEIGEIEKAEKNMENAREKLLIIQKKVSMDTADEVKNNVDGVIDKINNHKELKETFETYALEEEKTLLTAELVAEVEGNGEKVKREIIKDKATKQQMVKMEVQSEDKGQNIVEIEGKIGQVETQIAERTFAPGTYDTGQNGSDIKNVVINEGNASGDGGLKPEVKMDMQGENGSGNYGNGTEVKTYAEGDGTMKEEPLPEPDLNAINPDLYDPNARAPGDTIDETYDDAIIGENCGDGVVCS